MCYSAQIQADHRRYVSDFGVELDVKVFYGLFWRRANGAKLLIPKGMEAALSEPTEVAERRIKATIDEFAGPGDGQAGAGSVQAAHASGPMPSTSC